MGLERLLKLKGIVPTLVRAEGSGEIPVRRGSNEFHPRRRGADSQHTGLEDVAVGTLEIEDTLALEPSLYLVRRQRRLEAAVGIHPDHGVESGKPQRVFD